VLHCRSGWGAFYSSLRSTEMAERSSRDIVLFVFAGLIPTLSGALEAQ